MEMDLGTTEGFQLNMLNLSFPRACAAGTWKCVSGAQKRD